MHFFGYFLCASKESNPLAAGEWKLVLFIATKDQKPKQELDSRLRGNDEQQQSRWIPAFAGMTSKDEVAGLRTAIPPKAHGNDKLNGDSRTIKVKVRS